ncbi:MAG: hypothetical protein F4Y92_02415 [Dehalococcoidia bacterium]|nr:hypothetical protein [Dehalococcoidia bacterium]MYH67396.1 hypothetical protein [Dehalococcoidia bacterium]
MEFLSDLAEDFARPSAKTVWECLAIVFSVGAVIWSGSRLGWMILFRWTPAQRDYWFGTTARERLKTEGKRRRSSPAQPDPFPTPPEVTMADWFLPED